jgi:SagB-type dehydrogenase family enzyme
MNVNGVETATQTLHRLTSYNPSLPWDEAQDDDRLVQDFQPNDMDRFPFFTKKYADGLPRTPLPRDLPVTTAPALAVLAGTAQPTASRLDLAGLSRVLHLSAGVVRIRPWEDNPYLFRAAGSAGGRFPLELYVSVPDDTPDLPAGVHWYEPVDHALVQVGPPPRQEGSQTQAPTIIVTGVPWRTGWRYRERGFRHVYWDAGTMLSQLLAVADSAGLAPRLHTRFADAGVSALVGADQVHEWPVALVTLGGATPAVDCAGPAAVGQIDSAPLEFPLVTAAQQAGDLDQAGEPWEPGATVELPSTESPSLDQVITKRGSQRRMDPSRGLPLDTLRACMALALRGISVDHWVAAHDVTGLASGIYQWPNLDDAVHSATQEEMRAELHRVCLEQSLGRDAAFVVISTTDVSQLSDREYREAQLAAGIAEGRMHLAAYALGASATGMTFLDSEIPGLLDRPHALLFTCVGVPGNASKPGGAPGTPTQIQGTRPRE